MSAIARILCAVDFSECSRHALEQAIALGREYRAPVIVLHAFAVAPVTGRIIVGAPIVLEPAHGSTALLGSLRTELEGFAGSVDARGTPLQLELVEGDPVDAIVKTADTLHVDLIVVGTHGRSGMDRLFLGSVAESVLRKSTCPVLTVSGRAEPAASLRFARILCAVDFSPASLRALQRTAELVPGAELCAMHVVELMTDDGKGLRDGVADPADDYREAFRRAALDRLNVAIPAALGDDWHVRPLVTIGRPHRELVRIAESERYDLIVLGVESRNTADLLLFGSTTEHVLRQAPCPVLTIRH